MWVRGREPTLEDKLHLQIGDVVVAHFVGEYKVLGIVRGFGSGRYEPHPPTIKLFFPASNQGAVYDPENIVEIVETHSMQPNETWEERLHRFRKEYKNHRYNNKYVVGWDGNLYIGTPKYMN